MVVDVQPGFIAFDVLKKNILAESVAGKAGEILGRLAGSAGDKASPTAHQFIPKGCLGLLPWIRKAAGEVISRSSEIGQAVARAVSRRACVFSSGSEVISGKIEDTNSPYLVRALTEAGFKAEFGGIIEDSLSAAVSGD